MKEAGVMVPGCALLVLGFLAFAVFFPKGGARPAAPEAVVAAPLASPATSPSAPTLWPAQPAQPEVLRFHAETSSVAPRVEASDAPKPGISQELSEISCPNCGGSGHYAVEGTSQSCPMCRGTGRCRGRIDPRP